MNRNAPLVAAALMVGALAPLTAGAQERGRTDGPEGSEYGKGGYVSARGDGRLSLQLDWGAGVTQDVSEQNDGPPLFLGATLTYWGDDWLGLDLSGAYLFDGQRINVLAGPRFRTWGGPLSVHLSMKAGILHIPDEDLAGDDGSIRFGISPEVGMDLFLDRNEHLVAGFAYSPDIPVGGGEVAHRIGMNVGYRF